MPCAVPNEIAKLKKVRNQVRGEMNCLDKIINPQKARFVMVGARPAMGKTNFMLNFVCHKIREENASVLYFHLEEGKQNLMERLLAIQSSESYLDLRKGKEKNEANVEKARQEMKEWKLSLDENYRMEKVVEKIRKTKSQKGLQYVVIDSWEFLSSENVECLSRMDELNKMAQQLKELAEELQICILCTSQLSRKPEERENHRPMLTDFSRSKKGIPVADVVVLLYREGYYEKKQEETENMEVIVIQNEEECQSIWYRVNWDCLQMKEEREEN